MYARINYKVVFSQAPFFRYVLYGYTLYILYTSPRKMKEYVFFIKKRTLRLQRKSVKIAEKVRLSAKIIKWNCNKFDGISLSLQW